jgi:hypothetical protein
LEKEKVVKDHPTPRMAGFRIGLREVQSPKGLGERLKLEPLSKRLRQRIGNLCGVRIEETKDQRAERALSEPIGQRIDGNEPTHVDALIVVVLHNLKIRVLHLKRPAAKLSHLSVQNHALAAPKDPL